MFLNVKHLGYLLVRFLFKHIKVENGSATIRQFGNKSHQLLFGDSNPSSRVRYIRYIGKLLFMHYQLADSFLPPQEIELLSDHHPGYPCTERRLAPEREVGKNLDETVMQYIVRRIHIARIAETYRQHLFGIEGVKFLSG